MQNTTERVQWLFIFACVYIYPFLFFIYSFIPHLVFVSSAETIERTVIKTGTRLNWYISNMERKRRNQCFRSQVRCFNSHQESSSTNLLICQNSVFSFRSGVINGHVLLYSRIFLYVKKMAVSHWVRHTVRHREGCGLQLWPLSLDSGQIQMTNVNRQRAVHAHIQAQTSKIYVCAYYYKCT